jgi:ATP-dependent protease ClpP protease subunit
MQKEISLKGIVGEGKNITLANVTNETKELKAGDELVVKLDSLGGDLNEGISIYNYFKNSPFSVKMVADGDIGSIATVMFLAGDKREIDPSKGYRFMTHLPQAEVKGVVNSLSAEKIKSTLDEARNKAATIYESETSMSFGDAIKMMEKEEALSGDDLMDKGFLKLQVAQCVAFINIEDVKNSFTIDSTDFQDVVVEGRDSIEQVEVGDTVTQLGEPFTGLIETTNGYLVDVKDGKVVEITKTEGEEGEVPQIDEEALIAKIVERLSSSSKEKALAEELEKVTNRLVKMEVNFGKHKPTPQERNIEKGGKSWYKNLNLTNL